jgi:ketosteroid isomerase-like protein
VRVLERVRCVALTVVTVGAMLASGCGGGGGASSSSGQTPGAAVQQRTRAWNSAVIREDLDGLMSLYSATFTTEDGQNKEQTQQENRLMFEQFDFLQIDVVNEQFTVNSTSTAVTVDGTYRVTARVRDSGEQVTMDVHSLMEWGREGSVWRLVHEFTADGSTQSVTTAMAHRMP